MDFHGSKGKGATPARSGLLAALILLAGSGPGAAQALPRPRTHGFMPLDPALLERTEAQRARAARFEGGRVLAGPQPLSLDLLGDVATVGALRDQAGSGNCWVWASSAMAEAALKEGFGYADSLSIQYVDSLMDANQFRGGGSLTDYAKLINTAGRLVPWNNANAGYVDGAVTLHVATSLTPPEAIQTSPAYTHATVTPRTLATQNVGQAVAIANIKNALNLRKVVGFTFVTRFLNAGGFDEWWSTQPEGTLWPEAVAGPTGTPDGTWGGHMNVVVGYDEQDPDPAKHYWILLNSWGITATRPTGLWRLPMAMAYDATYTSGGTYPAYGFEALDLVVDHPAATAPTVALLPVPAPALGDAFTLTAQVGGYPPVSYQWREHGQPIPGATSGAFTLPCLTASDGGRTFEVVVTSPLAQASATSPAQAVADLSAQRQLLADPGFEDGAGQTAWAITATLAQDPADPLSQYVQDRAGLAHTGAWCFTYGENGAMQYQYGTLEQAVAIPQGPGTATLGYWLRGGEGGGPFGGGDGFLQVTILDAATGAVLRTFRNHGSYQSDHLLWEHERFGLTDLKGATIKVHVAWMNLFAYWRLDDLALVLDPLAPDTLPVLDTVTPNAGNPGDTLVLTGSGFTGARLVTLNGLAARFTVDSDTHMTVILLGDYSDQMSSGYLAVTTPVGTAMSPAPFRILRPLLNACQPSRARRGTPVTLTGSGLSGATAVRFLGVDGGPAPADFTVDSDLQITAVVPAGAVTGEIKVTTPYGSATYSWFSVAPNGSITLTIDPRPLALLAGSSPMFSSKVTGDLDQRAGWTYRTQTATSSLTTTEYGQPVSIQFYLDPLARSLTVTAVAAADASAVDTLTVPVKTLDLLGTGTIDAMSMLTFARAYGSATGGENFNADADFNGDGVIDDLDVAIFLANY